MKSKFDVIGGAGELHLSGEITIGQAYHFKTAMMEAIEDCKELTVDLRNVSKADMACLQIICAVCRGFTTESRKLSIHGLDSDVFSRLAKDAGLDHVRQCHFNELVTCLWARGICNG